MIIASTLKGYIIWKVVYRRGEPLMKGTEYEIEEKFAKIAEEIAGML